MQSPNERQLEENCTRFRLLFHSAFQASPVNAPSPPALMDVLLNAPYNERNQLFGRIHPSAARSQVYPQSAQDRLPDEGQPPAERAQAFGSLGADEDLPANPPSP